MQSRRNLVAEVMAEHVIYGGLLATRQEVYDDVIALGHDWKWADYIACGTHAKTVDPNDHQHRPTLKQIREQENRRVAV